MKHRPWIFPVSLCVLAAYLALYAASGRGWIFPRSIALSAQLSPGLTGVRPGLLVAVAMLALTAAFGRGYCLLLCPAGILQELFSRVGAALRLRRLRYAAAPGRALLLLVVGLAFVFGLRAPAQWTDPLGVFGRLAAASPGGAAGWAALVLGAGVLIVLPLFRGRVFCDRFCPAGALLGVAARAGGRGPAIDGERCVSCGACERVCPVQCADPAAKTIAPDRCLACGACARVCRPGAITRGGTASPNAPGERRAFLGSAAVGAAGVFALSRPLSGVFAKATGAESPSPKTTPPGTGGDARHRQFCVGCQACVPACPMGIIRMGEGGDLRPVLDYDRGFCQYTCRDCLDSCPTGAFLPLTQEEKQRTRVARVTLELSRCVVTLNGTACGACAEVCPTHAVRMTERGGGLASIPEFDAGYCIGCGACYHACPAEPRAFTVRGLSRHETSLGVREGGDAAAPARPLPEPGELTDFPF